MMRYSVFVCLLSGGGPVVCRVRVFLLQTRAYEAPARLICSLSSHLCSFFQLRVDFVCRFSLAFLVTFRVSLRDGDNKTNRFFSQLHFNLC